MGAKVNKHKHSEEDRFKTDIAGDIGLLCDTPHQSSMRTSALFKHTSAEHCTCECSGLALHQRVRLVIAYIGHPHRVARPRQSWAFFGTPEVAKQSIQMRNLAPYSWMPQGHLLDSRFGITLKSHTLDTRRRPTAQDDSPTARSQPTQPVRKYAPAKMRSRNAHTKGGLPSAPTAKAWTTQPCSKGQR